MPPAEKLVIARSEHRLPVKEPKVSVKLEPISPRHRGSLIHPERDCTLSGLQFSPDGKRIMAGKYGGGAVQVWDTTTGRYRPLPGTLENAVFSNDGKTIATAVVDEAGSYQSAIKVLDVATGRVKCSIAVPDFSFAHASAFSGDGKLVVGGVQVFPKEGVYEDYQIHLKIWDAASGKELASFAPEAKNVMLRAEKLSPDDRWLAAVCFDGEVGKLHIFDVAGRKLHKTVVLALKRSEAERVAVAFPAFSPDSRWIVVATRQNVKQGSHDPEDLPQYRIHLVDVRTGEIRETLVAPQAHLSSFCFSPDGKTLASAGLGKVELWDLSKPIGLPPDNSP